MGSRGVHIDDLEELGVGESFTWGTTIWKKEAEGEWSESVESGRGRGRDIRYWTRDEFIEEFHL